MGGKGVRSAACRGPFGTGAKWCVAGVAFLAVVSFFQYVCRSALLGLVLFFAVCALINHW